MSERTTARPPRERPARPPTRTPATHAPKEDTDEAHGGAARTRGRARRTLAACREILRRVPQAAWACALVATLSAACWSLITPPFQLPDEPSHFAYAQLLAETGHLPSSGNNTFSPEETTILSDLNQPGVRWHPEVGTISAGPQQQTLQRDLARPLSRVGAGGAGVAATEPPLYYALETIPYQLGSGGTLLDRLELMRLLSALMAGLTALFTYMFVREALPAARWAWIVGGLAAALAPLLGFTSGGVTPDAMLFAVCAAIFYCLARAFRRGLTWRLALAAGTLIAVGFLTKVNFVGLVPGLMLGLLVLSLRGVRGVDGAGRRKRAFGPAAVAAAIAMSPVCLYVVRNLLEHHPTLGIVSSAYSQQGHDSLASDFTYIWQLYLPRLPGMYDYLPGLSTLRQVWFDRAVGLYGWLDTDFPEWVYTVALIPAGLIAILALRALVASRGALRARLSELAVYLTISAGLMALIGQDSHLNRSLEGVGYAQPRYLMPLMPLGAAVLVLAARGAGRRWGPAAGVLIVTLFLAQDIFSQLLVVSRFYA